MTKVYIWSREGEIGHTSMQIGNEYVSYWPGGDADAKKDIKLKKTHAPHFMTQYGGDRRVERRPADSMVELPNLNEAAMLAAWRDIKSTAPRYNMRNHNCSTVVAMLIEVGSCKPAPFVPEVDPRKYVGSGALGVVARMATFGRNIKMWTPEAVHEYAKSVR
jgi:hypothetical protein